MNILRATKKTLPDPSGKVFQIRVEVPHNRLVRGIKLVLEVLSNRYQSKKTSSENPRICEVSGAFAIIPTRSRSAVFKQLCLENMRCGIQYIGIIHRVLTIRFFVAMVLP